MYPPCDGINWDFGPRGKNSLNASPSMQRVLTGRVLGICSEVNNSPVCKRGLTTTVTGLNYRWKV